MKRWQPAWIVFSIVVLFGLLPGCSDEGTPPSDATGPGRVSDLTVADVDDSTVTLAWTAPGDDGTAGTVASYEIRWLDSPVTEPDWSAGTSVGPVPEPTPAGTRQTARVRGVPPGRRRYLALKARDDAGNESFHSNVVDAQTGAPVCHLEADTLDFGRTPVGLAFDLTLRLVHPPVRRRGARAPSWGAPDPADPLHPDLVRTRLVSPRGESALCRPRLPGGGNRARADRLCDPALRNGQPDVSDGEPPR